MTPIAPISSGLSASSEPSELHAAFQDTVGSLFYGEMIKAMRSGVGKPAYIHGGQAEEMFQAQMDQEVAANFARSHGAPLVEKLYQRFLIDHPEGRTSQPAELSSLRQTVNSAPSVEAAQASTWARPLTSVARNTTGTPVISALNRK